MKNLNEIKILKNKEEILKEEINNYLEKIIQFFDEEEIKKSAKETKFVQRESKLTGTLFLLVYVFGIAKYGDPTLEDLTGLLNMYIDGFNITKQGLHDRLNEQATQFFEKILFQTLNLKIPEKLKLQLPKQFPRILIWDTTNFQLPAKLADAFRGNGGSSSPAGIKIHFGDDFNSQEWFYHISSATDSDTSMKENIIDKIQPKDLTIYDLGYYNVEIFQHIESKGGYYLSRMKTTAKVYQKNVYGKYILLI